MIESKKHEQVVRSAKQEAEAAKAELADAKSQIADRALKRLCETRGYLKFIREFANNMSMVENDRGLRDSERLVKFRLSIAYLQKMAHKVALEPLDQDISFLRTLLSPQAESMSTACTGFETPTAHSDRLSSSKYHLQLDKLKTENKMLQKEVTGLEKTLAAFSKDPESHPTRVSRSATPIKQPFEVSCDRPQDCHDSSSKSSGIKSILRSLALLSKRRTASIEARLNRMQDELNISRAEAEKYQRSSQASDLRYHDLFTKYTSQTKDVHKSLEFQNAKIASVCGLATRQEEQHKSLERELSMAHAIIEGLLKKLNQTGAPVSGKENEVGCHIQGAENGVKPTTNDLCAALETTVETLKKVNSESDLHLDHRTRNTEAPYGTYAIREGLTIGGKRGLSKYFSHPT